MKKTLSLILLLAIFMPIVNAQSNKVLFYLKTDVLPESDKTMVASQPSFNAQSGDEMVYTTVEKMPEFPGGQQAMNRYLSENIKYPVIARENNVQGRVIVQFVVEKDGSVTNVKVVRSVDPSLDKEAKRVISSMPKWNPGKQRGKVVRVQYTVPVSFKLQ